MVSLDVEGHEGESKPVVEPDEEVRLVWRAALAAECEINHSIGPVNPLAGTHLIGEMTRNKKYTITCRNPFGQSVDSVDISVEADVPGTRSTTFWSVYDDEYRDYNFLDLYFSGQGHFAVDTTAGTVYAYKAHTASVIVTNPGCISTIKIVVDGPEGRRETPVPDVRSGAPITLELFAGDQLSLSAEVIRHDPKYKVCPQFAGTFTTNKRLYLSRPIP